MLNTLVICAATLVCVYVIAHADVKITVVHRTDSPTNTTAPVDIDKVYEAVEKDKDTPPDFASVIAAINEEFGGVNNGTE